MCSIIGYSGGGAVAYALVEGLKKMEYRGYDSVGVATLDNGKILLRKGVGKVEDVDRSLTLHALPGNLGIGHTRWATHGAVISSNAHPHMACSSDIAVVHNGIIENYDDLKKELISLGHVFRSETDSEVISHLLEHFYKIEGNVKKAMLRTCRKLKGSFAFVAIFNNSCLAGARYDEPLIIGMSREGFFIASDVLGFLKYTDRATFLDNRDIVLIEDKDISLFNFDGEKVFRPITQVAWELGSSDKGKYVHHTLKEIYEQNSTILKTMEQKKENLQIFCNLLKNAKDVYITGSGTSYHSALIAKYVFSKYARIRTETIMSSEFEYSSDLLDSNSVLLAISQSGETADVLQSVKHAKQKGAKVLSIVNIPSSSLARISDSFLEVKCGPEIGVAATKSFTGQLALIYYIADLVGDNQVGIAGDKLLVSKIIEETLELEGKIAEITEQARNARDIYILGRSIHYPICLEGALKIKELAYIHAEGMAAGELKHGPLALIDKNSLVIVLHPSDSTFSDTLSNAHVIKSRGATLIGITNQKNPIYEHNIVIPKLKDPLMPLIEVIPLQMIAYHLALYNNANPDYPRNLAKSVTVK